MDRSPAPLETWERRHDSVQLTWLKGPDPRPNSPVVLPVRMVYRLHNPGPARAERVGIRATWSYYAVELPWSPPPDTHRRAAPPVKVNGQPFACELEAPQWRPWGPGGGDWGGAEAWCVGTLPVPAGDSTVVVEYQDRLHARAHYWGTLRRDFSAEVSWPGPTQRVEVAASLAILPGLPLVVGPAGHVVEAGVLRWRLDRPGLATLPPILVGANDLTQRRAPMRLANRGYAFAASSRLAAEAHHRYDPDRALDGDGGTAWCEGVPGPGLGEWIEVRPRLDPGLAARCWLVGFSVIPGVARDPGLWRANNRVRRLRISSCAHPEEGAEVDLSTYLPGPGYPPRPLSDDPRRAGTKYELEDEVFAPVGSKEHALAHERECFRLTILAVEPGTVDDTCVGEFVPLLTCREDGYAYPIRPVP